jgi:hypothetical protein
MGLPGTPTTFRELDHPRVWGGGYRTVPKVTEALGVLEAGGGLCPLRLHRTSRRPASAKGATCVRGSGGHTISYPAGQKIGSAEEVFVNRDSEPEYGMVQTGLLGMTCVLIPGQFVQTDEKDASPEVGVSCIPPKLKGT